MTPRSVLTLIRVEHWVKNFFIFIPAFFAARLFERGVLIQALGGFAAFSLIASGVYVFNDLIDAPSDRQHPEKCRRPIASGAINRTQGIVLCAILLLSGAALAAWLHSSMLLYSLLYLLINILYSVSLKHYALIDISLIAIGFLLREFAGAAITGVGMSQWLIVLTFLLALILALAKRRGEYIIATGNNNFRKALEGYNLPFLDAAITVCATVAIVAYLMYCFSPEVTERLRSTQIYFTAFFVILGIMRYLQLTLVFNKTESPTRALLRDPFLQIVLLCWIGAFAWLLYR